jgi:predicted metalloprotease with PDZ domain
MMFFPAAMMLIAAVSLAPAAQPATPPVTPPTTAPATQPSEQIHRWFDQLADADPAVRDAARVNLMGMKRDQLDQFKQLIEENRPLAPSQLAVLHDIVIHVYLAGEPYEKFPGTSMIGVRLLKTISTTIPGDDEGADWTTQRRVVVTERFPGFPAYRFLSNDDVILGVLRPDLIPITDFEDFQQEVIHKSPGDAITLQILRQGRVIELSFRVESQPLGATVQFFNARSDKAEDYWNKTFTPLLPAPIS